MSHLTTNILYSSYRLESDIIFQEMPFPDGGTPSDAVISQWTSLVRSVAKESEGGNIGVHCVAGLGRYIMTFIFSAASLHFAFIINKTQSSVIVSLISYLYLELIKMHFFCLAFAAEPQRCILVRLCRTYKMHLLRHSCNEITQN